MLSSSLTYHHYTPNFGHYNNREPHPNEVQQQSQQQQQQQQQQQHNTSALDTLAESSQYALHDLQQQQQQQQQHQQHPHQNYASSMADGKLLLRHRHHPYRSGQFSGVGRPHKEGSNQEKGPRMSSGSNPVRRRISRACDQCNQLRTKCDGKNPCAHCVEFGLTCEYIRERKKRGKASRKDIAKQQAAAAAAAVSGGQEVSQGSPGSINDNSADERNDIDPAEGASERRSSLGQSQFGVHQAGQQMDNGEAVYGHLGSISSSNAMAHGHEPSGHGVPHVPSHDGSTMSIPTPRGLLELDHYGALDEYQRSMLPHGGQSPTHAAANGLSQHVVTASGIQFGDGAYSMMTPQSQNGVPNPFRMAPGDSPLHPGFLGQSPVAPSPGWLSIPSPTAALYQQASQAQGAQSLRYPVLKPLLPHLGAIMPIALASDLLELYFTSPTSAYMRPESPYLLGYVFRKRSFLRQHNPRPSSPALLASMLWVAAQTSESSFLTSPPSSRGKVCQKLLELTIGLLRPLVHSPTGGASPDPTSNAVLNGVPLPGFGQVSLGGFGVAVPSTPTDPECQVPGASGQLDDVVTYVHLATVVSASEYKAASLRWWNAAWSLARELKLGRELPPNPREPTRPEMEGDGDLDGSVVLGSEAHSSIARGEQRPSPPGFASEEEREERRRIWWLVYSMDRHLSLCYNKPLFLLDRECDGLLQPIDDTIWQAGDYYPEGLTEFEHYPRRRGPHFECTGHSIFGYFLPLMTILGEIVDLNQARNHPRFGMRFRGNSSEWDDSATEITQQLEAYGRSLKEFEARYITAPTEAMAHNADAHEAAGTPSAQSVSTVHSRPTEALIQSRIVLAYATHLMHTLHVLINGKWDPINLLDDNDLWISTPSFVSATGHAVHAAEALAEILEDDPDLGFMPFFFGIYMLQGSFLLLLIADKLKEEVAEGVVRACETIVRAHEACVATLNTEYQRNFRKVMRSALAQVKGRLPEDFGEQQLRRRETLALYRWTGDGTGLAL
ncbi:MAG: hypothetical protein M1820_000814 [Bogoriella megaspora]|nr:MAG: hypothetical protein M1820_000814 [Bogoriella megaspora]